MVWRGRNEMEWKEWYGEEEMRWRGRNEMERKK